MGAVMGNAIGADLQSGGQKLDVGHGQGSFSVENVRAQTRMYSEQCGKTRSVDAVGCEEMPKRGND